MADIKGNDSNNTLTGTSSDEVISGVGGNDTIDGGSGNDVIFGGDGDDVITGGRGDDIIIGGAGNDTLTAGMNSTTDMFVYRDGDGSDTITDFDPAEPDVLAFNMVEITSYQDLIDRVSMDGSDTLITYDNGDTTRLINVNSSDLTIANFSTQAAPICLHAGTRVQTPQGWRWVQDLKAGDMVLTENGTGEQIVAVCSQRMHFKNEEDRASSIVFAQGCLGNGVPYNDCIVSPQHRVVVARPSGELALVAAVALCGRDGIKRVAGQTLAAYHNILLKRHAIISAEGLAVETALLTEFTSKAFDVAYDGRKKMPAAFPVRKAINPRIQPVDMQTIMNMRLNALVE
jgi:hypothetical protein